MITNKTERVKKKVCKSNGAILYLTLIIIYAFVVIKKLPFEKK